MLFIRPPIFSALLLGQTLLLYPSSLQIAASPSSPNYFCQANGTQAQFKAATADCRSVWSTIITFLFFTSIFSLMRSLCSFCIVYIYFLFPGGSLLSVRVLALLAWWQGVFSLHEGRCWEAGGLCFPGSFLTFFWLFLSLRLCFPPLILTLFMCDLPLNIFLQYQCQLWRAKLTSLQRVRLKDEEEERKKRGYLSMWSSQEAALPTWTGCFSRSTAGTEGNVDSPHIHNLF